MLLTSSCHVLFYYPDFHPSLFFTFPVFLPPSLPSFPNSLLTSFSSPPPFPSLPPPPSNPLPSQGNNIRSAGPSTPVRLLGLRSLPTAGQELLSVANEAKARQIADRRQRTLALKEARY